MGWIIATLSLAFVIISAGIGVFVRYVQYQAREADQVLRQEVLKEIEGIRKDIVERVDRDMRAIGATVETIRFQHLESMRQIEGKAHEAEKFYLQNFQRRDSFVTVIAEMKVEIREALTEVKNDMKSIESKLDAIKSAERM